MPWKSAGGAFRFSGGGHTQIPNEGIKLVFGSGLTALTASKRYPGKDTQEIPKDAYSQGPTLKALFS